VNDDERRRQRRLQQREYRKRRVLLGAVYDERYNFVGGEMLVPALGTQRRIRALIRLGWSSGQLAPLLGKRSAQSVTNILRREVVRRETAARVDVVYRRLFWVAGTSIYARSYAEKMDWAPPAAWDDIDNPNEIPRTPRQERKEKWQKQKKDLAARRAINAQNHQRRKAKKETVAA
jgi:hypothetical protein